MRVCTLVENTALDERFEAEHGLSLYIETGRHKILFDSGQSTLFAKNAEKMGIDLKEVDTAVLSHGHYDHGGGLPYFLQINQKAKVYIHEHAFDPHFNGTEKYIGLSEELKNSDRIVFTKGRMALDDELTLDDAQEKKLLLPVNPFGLNVKEGDTFIPDTFLHEQYLSIREKGRHILISGCSHRGIVNIESWFEPDILIGGFHFMRMDVEKDKDTLTRAAENLLSHPTIYYTGHCTGLPAYHFLKEIMGDRLHAITTGLDIIL